MLLWLLVPVGVVFIVYLLLVKLFSFPAALDSIPRIPGQTFFKQIQDFADRKLLFHLIRYAKGGDVTMLNYFGRPIVIVNSPELGHQVINDSKTYNKGVDFFFGYLFGSGLASSNGDKWKTHRGLLQPSFNSKAVTAMQRVMLDCACRYTQRLKKRLHQGESEGESESESGSVTLSLNEEMKALTLNMLTETIFGFEASKELEEALAVIGRDFGLASLPYAVPYVGWMLPNPKLKLVVKARDTIFSIVEGLINARLEKEKQGEPIETRSILDVFMDNREAFSTDDIKYNILTLFFGGHDTTAYSITWALYFLGLEENKEAKDRLVAELCASKNEPRPDTQIVNQFPFTCNVIKEGLRLRPPAIVTTRTAIKDTTIGQYHIPAGTTCWVNISAMQVDERLWGEPFAFRPDRFLSGEKVKASWIPFGGGVRRCLGENMSMNEQVIILWYLFNSFNIEVLNAKEVEPLVSLTLIPSPDLRVRLSLRD